ncbi:MAG TPA: S-layer homology domain-containing protein [Chloroflexia bacterium]|nr:S-layer homology domain-containing protein [Chloroflexia bacterium]
MPVSDLPGKGHHPRFFSLLQLLRNACIVAGITVAFTTVLLAIWTQGSVNAAQPTGNSSYLPEGTIFDPPTNTPTRTPTRTSTPPPATAQPTATTTPCPIQFQDVPADYTFYSVVRCLACRDILGGYPCGATDEPCGESGDPYFRPSAKISRGQIAKIVANAAGLDDPPGTRIFEDVAEGSTFYDYIQRLTNKGYISGYPCGGTGEPCQPGNRPYFRPGANATRGQLSKIVSNAAEIEDAVSGQTYEDVAPNSPFYLYIERLSALNVMSGYPCGGLGEPCQPGNRPYFRPNADVTRGQAAKIVANTFFPGCDTPARK